MDLLKNHRFRESPNAIKPTSRTSGRLLAVFGSSVAVFGLVVGVATAWAGACLVAGVPEGLGVAA